MEKRILVVFRVKSTFVENDIKILQKFYSVRQVKYQSIFSAFKILRELKKSDICFCWFADRWAAFAIFFSKFLGKRSIVVAGGYDVARVPEISYGAILSPIRALIVKFVLRNADIVLAVSEFTRKEVLQIANPTAVKMVYNGCEPEFFKPSDSKQDLILTVGIITGGSKEKKKIKLKGLETFIDCAKFLQDRKFVIIGLSEDVIKYLSRFSSPNVELVGYLSHQTLKPYYQKAKVYCQLSYRESFGMSLAEAMLCECVPLVTAKGALPEVVGDTGFYVPYNDPKATAEAIKKALASPEKGKMARERIIKLFSLEQREKQLISIINELLVKSERR